MRIQKLLIALFVAFISLQFAVNCGGDKTDNTNKENSGTTENKTETTPSNEGGLSADEKKGQELFSQNCASCHGEKGLGDGPAAAALNPKPRKFNAPASEWKNGNTEDKILKTLNEGISGSPMVAYKHLGDENLKALAKYILFLSKQK
ncbi:MAG: cytochrome c [Leptospiraceae bacterium]|nr:cytochrome c [Leptospiraceae bacterium]MCP5501336.1 cytochrome c [Leptospiraceae bacterium]